MLQESSRVRKALKTKGGPKWENFGYDAGSGGKRVPSRDTLAEPKVRIPHPLLFVK